MDGRGLSGVAQAQTQDNCAVLLRRALTEVCVGASEELLELVEPGGLSFT